MAFLVNNCEGMMHYVFWRIPMQIRLLHLSVKWIWRVMHKIVILWSKIGVFWEDKTWLKSVSMPWLASLKIKVKFREDTKDLWYENGLSCVIICKVWFMMIYNTSLERNDVLQVEGLLVKSVALLLAMFYSAIW